MITDKFFAAGIIIHHSVHSRPYTVFKAEPHLVTLLIMSSISSKGGDFV
jgi:hypothetical protein